MTDTFHKCDMLVNRSYLFLCIIKITTIKKRVDAPTEAKNITQGNPC